MRYLFARVSVPQWMMKMFGFRRKNEVATEIKRLRSLLEKNPEDSKSRLTLANLYLRAGDQETAVKEYHASAKQLGAEGLGLESIAIYKKILSLDGISLTRESLASVEEAEELLAKARGAYEEVFQTEPRDNTAKEAAEAHCRGRTETEKDPEKTETPSGDDSEPVFTEMPQMSSQDQVGSEMPPCDNPEEDSPDLEPSDGLGECDSDGSGQEPFEPLDESLGEERSEDTVHETDITPETDSSYPRKDRQIDRNDIQIDDDLEAILSDDGTTPSTDNSLPVYSPLGLILFTLRRSLWSLVC
jgi:tetratricopeptide (TPR) repeat protein